MRSFWPGLLAMALAAGCTAPSPVPGAGSSQVPSWNDEGFALPEEVAKAIEAAAPQGPIVKPLRPRRILAYGRVPTHPESAAACFEALEILARKTGAFEVVLSGDPEAFAPESLKGFDAVIMNNTHEGRPLLPRRFGELPAEEQEAAALREAALKQCLLDFVASGKGIVGIHGAIAGVGWNEYLGMMGGSYGDHVTERVWVKAEEPGHALCAPLRAGAGETVSFQVHDEIYIFEEPYSRRGARVLLSLDLERTRDPGKRPDRDYPVSWIRRHGKGRVFYGSLGHTCEAFENPAVLRHYLAGIQFAAGDLEADAAPRGAPEPSGATKPPEGPQAPGGQTDDSGSRNDRSEE